MYLIKWFKIPLMQFASSFSFKLLNNSVQTTYYYKVQEHFIESNAIFFKLRFKGT